MRNAVPIALALALACARQPRRPGPAPPSPPPAAALAVIDAGADAARELALDPDLSLPMSDRQLTRVMLAMARPGRLEAMLEPDRSLVVVGFGLADPDHVCPDTGDRAERLGELAAQLPHSAGDVTCKSAPVAVCVTEGGTIDPPDSDWERRLYYFRRDAAGRVRLRSIVATGNYDRTADEDSADAARVPQRACRSSVAL